MQMHIKIPDIIPLKLFLKQIKNKYDEIIINNYINIDILKKISFTANEKSKNDNNIYNIKSNLLDFIDIKQKKITFECHKKSAKIICEKQNLQIKTNNIKYKNDFKNIKVDVNIKGILTFFPFYKLTNIISIYIKENIP